MGENKGNLKQLAVVVDGTAALAPYWSTIVKDYIEKIIRHFSVNVSGEQETVAEFGLVMYNTHGPHSSCLVQASGWTRDTERFMEWLQNLNFGGGGWEDAAVAEGLAEALVMFPRKASENVQAEDIIHGEKHCILVGASNPFLVPTVVYVPKIAQFSFGEFPVEQAESMLADAETVAKLTNKCFVSLSVMAAKQLPKYRDIFKAANPDDNGAEASFRNDKNPEFLILISERFPEARAALHAQEASNSSSVPNQPADPGHFVLPDDFELDLPDDVIMLLEYAVNDPSTYQHESNIPGEYNADEAIRELDALLSEEWRDSANREEPYPSFPISEGPQLPISEGSSILFTSQETIRTMDITNTTSVGLVTENICMINCGLQAQVISSIAPNMVSCIPQPQLISSMDDMVNCVPQHQVISSMADVVNYLLQPQGISSIDDTGRCYGEQQIMVQTSGGTFHSLQSIPSGTPFAPGNFRYFQPAGLPIFPVGIQGPYQIGVPSPLTSGPIDGTQTNPQYCATGSSFAATSHYTQFPRILTRPQGTQRSILPMPPPGPRPVPISMGIVFNAPNIPPGSFSPRGSSAPGNLWVPRPPVGPLRDVDTDCLPNQGDKRYLPAPNVDKNAVAVANKTKPKGAGGQSRAPSGARTFRVAAQRPPRNIGRGMKSATGTNDRNASQSQSHKYVPAWQGNLSGVLNGQRVKVKSLVAYRRTETPPMITSRWPRTLRVSGLMRLDYFSDYLFAKRKEYVVFAVREYHEMFDHWKAKEMCSTVDLPSQRMVICPTGKERRFIGILYPGNFPLMGPEATRQPPQTEKKDGLQLGEQGEGSSTAAA